MKPENLRDTGNVIEARIADEGRAQMLEEVGVAQSRTIMAAQRAQQEIRSIYRMGNNTQTRIVVLDNRSVNDDPYSIVGMINLVGQDGGSVIQNAVVSLGVAFDRPVRVSQKAEKELGEGFDGRKWYGGWVHEEATLDAEEARKAIDTGLSPGSKDKLDSADIERYYENALKMLGSMQETIDVLVAAAKDPALNPVRDE